MKISVSSYSFGPMIFGGEITQLETLKLAKELGYDGMEISNFRVPEGMDLLDYAKQLKEESDRLEFPIINYCTVGNFALTGAAFDESLETLKKQVDAVAICGAKTMRHDPIRGLGDFKSFEEALPQIIKGVRMLTEYAETKGVKTMVENHGFICQEPDRLEALYYGVNHKNFGILLDMGNFLCAEVDPAEAYGRLAPIACFAHAKDFIVKPYGSDPGEGYELESRCGNRLRGTIIGHGVVPVEQCIHILKKNEYDGWLSVEFEGIEERMMALRINLENLRRYIERA